GRPLRTPNTGEIIGLVSGVLPAYILAAFWVQLACRTGSHSGWYSCCSERSVQGEKQVMDDGRGWPCSRSRMASARDRPPPAESPARAIWEAALPWLSSAR